MEQRQSPRRPVRLDVQIGIPSGETFQVSSRDISEGGMFLMMSPLQQPTIGEMVSLQVIDDSPEHLPSTEAIVVHRLDDGIGVAFIHIEED
ncbi:MAG: PilZ domain-containing protein [Gammaproteobacteria bacterium]